MLFGAAIVLHRLLAFQLSKNHSVLLAIGLIVGVCVAIWAHIQLGESTLHQVVFASMMLTSVFTTAMRITKNVRDKEAKWQMRKVGLLALGE